MDVKNMTALVLTRVLVLFLLCCSSHACNLQIWSGNTQLNTSDICEVEYNTTYCKEFLQSFNRSDLPYVEDGNFVERPESINIVGYRTAWEQIMYPSLSFRWDSPFSGSAREDLNGFLLALNIYGQTNSTICRIFKFKSNSEIRQQKLNYRFLVDYVTENADFDVRVYSMPPPPPEYQDHPNALVTMSARTPRAYSIGGNSSSWAPIVSYQARSNGTVDIWFSLSPPTFNFTLFEVNLLDSPSSVIRSVNYTGEVFSDAQPQGFVKFDNIPTGQYQIVVWVKDQFRGIPGQCQCWLQETNGKHCTNICGFTTTAWFQVNVTEAPSPPTTTSPEPSESPDSSPDSSPGSVEPNPTTPETGSSVQTPASPVNTGTIVGIVVACIVLLAVIILVSAICMKRDNPQVKRLVRVVRSWPWSRGPRDAVWTPRQQVPPSPLSTRNSCTVDLPTQTLYLMSVDDHEAHTQCVECLVEFLRAHCHCNVIYAPWDYTQDRGIYEWFQANMTKASRIMFIDSVAAFKLTQGYLQKKNYRPRKGKLGDELFKIGLKHLLSDQAEEARKQAVIVSFSGIRCQTILQAPQTYVVPDDLQLLLCKLHNIKIKDVRSYSSQLPVLPENIPQLEEGAKLLSAIEVLRPYEAKNPNSFKENFGEPMAILQPLTSVISNDSGIQSLRNYPHRSVSQQDLSEAGSPYSNLSQPMFTPPVGNENMPPSFSSSGPAALPYHHNPHIDPLLPSHYNYGRHQYENALNGGPIDLEGFSAVTLDTNALNDGARLGPPTSHRQLEPSVFTIDSEQVNQSEADLKFNKVKLPDGTSIIPPEIASGIDSYSNALRQFHGYDDRSLFHNPQSEPIQEATVGHQNHAMNAEEFQREIQPPDSLSDIQIDSVSSALAAFNIDSEIAFEGTRDLTEGADAASAYDCSSI